MGNKSLDDEFGIIRGKSISFNLFEGRTKKKHGFFIYNELLCHKNYQSDAVLIDYPELGFFDYYNRETNDIDIYWDGIRDGDFKEDIITIDYIKYIPFEFYKSLHFEPMEY